jgi:signal transduction histidine kinase
LLSFLDLYLGLYYSYIMPKKVKKPLFFVFMIAFVCLFLIGKSDIEIKNLEARLPGTSGEARLDLLVDLVFECAEVDTKKTLQYGKEAVALFQKYPGKQLLPLLHFLSLTHRQVGNYDKALWFGNEALALAQKQNDPIGSGEALEKIGWVYMKKGKLYNALDFAQQALIIYETAGEITLLPMVLNLTASIYWKLGNFSQALEYGLKSCDMLEADGKDTKMHANAYTIVGNIYYDLNDPKKAMEYYGKGLDTYRKNKNLRGVSTCLNNIAIIYKMQDKFTQALNYYNKSLEIREKIGNLPGVANSLNNIGSLLYAKDDFKQALIYFRKAHDLFKQVNSKPGMAYTMINLGATNGRLKTYPLALKQINKGLKQAEEVDSKIEIRMGYEELSVIYKEMGNYAQALTYYEKFKEINDTIYNEGNSKKITELQTRFDFEKKEKEVLLLRKDKEIQALALTKQKNQKNFLLALAILFILLCILAILFAINYKARYRLKVKSTDALEKEMDKRLRAENELLKSMKLESVGILAGGIAHDFNNLLTIILGNVSLVRELMITDPKADRMLKVAENMTSQAADLAQKLITFSRGGWVLMKEVNFGELLKNLGNHYPQFQHYVDNILLPPDLRTICGDERQLRQVMFNLIQNSDDAMSEPKQLSISVENTVVFQENYLDLDAGEYILINVKDNGPGILPEHINKVFDPYFSTKENVSQKGMGLGLAICYSIINKHHGYIGIDSVLEEGTTVQIYLPTYHEE